MDQARFVRRVARLSAAMGAGALALGPAKPPKIVADTQGPIMPDLSVRSRKFVRLCRRLHIFPLPAGSREWLAWRIG